MSDILYQQAEAVWLNLIRNEPAGPDATAQMAWSYVNAFRDESKKYCKPNRFVCVSTLCYGIKSWLNKEDGKLYCRGCSYEKNEKDTLLWLKSEGIDTDK